MSVCSLSFHLEFVAGSALPDITAQTHDSPASPRNCDLLPLWAQCHNARRGVKLPCSQRTNPALNAPISRPDCDAIKRHSTFPRVDGLLSRWPTNSLPDCS